MVDFLMEVLLDYLMGKCRIFDGIPDGFLKDLFWIVEEFLLELLWDLREPMWWTYVSSERCDVFIIIICLTEKDIIDYDIYYILKSSLHINWISAYNE